MQKKTILYYVAGCIKYSDVNGIVAWLERAKKWTSDSDYDKIVKKVASLVAKTKIEAAILERIRGDLSRIREKEERKKIHEAQKERIDLIKRQFLIRYRPSFFYHFTDLRNLPTIRQHGLLSLHEIRRRGIQIPAFGGNALSHELDKRRGLDRFVHLCFLNEHPMEYVAKVKEHRIGETKFIRVSCDVFQRDDILFTDGVANSMGRSLLNLEEAVATMDFEVIYDQTDWKDPEIQKRRNIAKKYELLIPRSIPTKYLLI